VGPLQNRSGGGASVLDEMSTGSPRELHRVHIAQAGLKGLMKQYFTISLGCIDVCVIQSTLKTRLPELVPPLEGYELAPKLGT
jgi:hypothetical protein